MRKPWYWKVRGAWFVDTDDGRIEVGESEEEAYQEWNRLLEIERRSDSLDPVFRDLVTSFVLFATKQVENGELSMDAFDDYGYYLDSFNEIHGDRFVSSIAPMHVTDWIADHPSWKSSSQRHAIGSVKRVLKWSLEEGRIEKNPLASMRKPKGGRREKLIDPDEHRTLVLTAGSQPSAGRIDRQFRLAIIATKHCGGRPQDVSNIRIEHIDSDLSRWVIPIHKTLRHTEKPRLVYLSPCLRTITMILMQGRSEGPLFRSRRGVLTTNAIRCRIRNIKKKLGMDPKIVMYSYRHTYITDSMARGVDIATVAELVGTSVTMIRRNYGHLEKRTDHLKDAAVRAVGGSQESK